jgi:glycogen(starch) synthase
MKILLINSEYPPIGGGAGNASAHLARALAQLGDEVTVLTVRFGGLPIEEQQGLVRVVRVNGLRRRADRSGAVEQASFLLAGAMGARRLLRRWRPDVTLAFFGVPGGAVAWHLRSVLGIPYVVSLRGGDVPGFRPYDFALYHRLIAPVIRRVWHGAQAVVANSQGLHQLASRFDSRVPIDIIPNGVDLARFAVSERTWEPPRMLFVGRVVYQKGLDLLLEALGGLRQIPWELVVAGDGSQREPLTGRARDLGLAERIRFAGWLRGDKILQAYRRANLLVFPSRHEGMPNAVLEAMAAGLPVIASRIAGNEELVVDGETGVLVPAEDPGALQQALAALLPDSKRRAAMGAAGRKRVGERYTWDQVAAAYHELLSKAAGTR